MGAILYELLTGKPPFLGATARDTLLLVATGEAEAPRSRNAAIPLDLDAICRKCLAKSPTERYVTARGLAEDLNNFLAGRAVSVRPLNAGQRLQRWARREPTVAALAAAALLALLLGLLATSLQWQRAEQQSELARQHASQARNLLWDRRLADTAVLLKQNKPLDALPDLVQNLAEQEAAGADDEVEWSRLRIGSLLSNAPVLVDSIAVDARIGNILFDQQGHWLVLTADNGARVQRYDLATGERRWELQVAGFHRASRLVLTSDGQHLLAESLNAGVPIARGLTNHLIDLATGQSIAPPDDRFPEIQGTHFSPDGSFAVVVTASATAGGTPLGRLVRVSDWQVVGVEKPLSGLALLGPGGDWLAYHHGLRAAEAAAANLPAIEVLDARSMRRLWHYEPADRAALCGWRIAPGGDQLALGFANGDVGLFDPTDGARRDLPSVVGAAVDDLFFSADGMWIAASHRDGSVQVWDTEHAAAVTLPLRLSEQQTATVGDITLNPARRLLFAGTEDGAGLWRIEGPQLPAVRVFERPSYPRSIANTANAAAIEPGLVASGAIDGELRIWRQRSSPALAARAPLREMRDQQRRFDGRHVLDVDGARVQLVGLTSQPDGALLEFSQAVGFAYASTDGLLVLATAGTQLHLRDAVSGDPRWAPVSLPATPSAVLFAADARRIVIAWQERNHSRTSLALRSIDAGNGQTLAETRLDHPAYDLQLSDAGESLIAWRHGKLMLLAVDTLQPRWPAKQYSDDDAYTPVRSARLGRDGRTLWVMTGAGDEDGYRLRAVDAPTGEELQAWRMPTWALALQPFNQGRSVVALSPGSGDLRIHHLAGETRVIPIGDLDPWGYPGMALSGDESQLVVGLRRGIQWLRLPQGDWLSPPLQAIAHESQFAGVALDSTGTVALIRDTDRHQWRHQLIREMRSVEELQALSDSNVPSEQDLPHAFAVAKDWGTRASLRASDPGPPAATPERPSTAIADQVLDSQFVDLRPHCNFDLATYPNALHISPRIDRLLAPGRQRLLGVEFEVHCGIATTYTADAAANVAQGSRIEGIAVAMANMGAVQLLVLAPTMLRTEAFDDYGILEFAYRDGSRERSALVYLRDLEAWFNPDYSGRLAALPVAYVGLGAQFSQLGAAATVAPSVYAIRVVNPHPERPVASLAFESTRHAWSKPLLLAATLEPVPSTTSSESGDSP